MKKLLVLLVLLAAPAFAQQKFSLYDRARMQGTAGICAKGGMTVSNDAYGNMVCVAPGTSTYVWTSNGAGSLPSWQAPGAGSGTVTTVGNGTIGSLFSVSWATATTTPAMSLALAAQTGNCVIASPSGGGSGVPTCRSLVANDIPSLAGSIIGSGTVAAARLGLATGDAGSGGTSGAVPAPGIGDAAKVLSGAMTYIAPGGGGTVTNIATTGPITGGPITATGTIGISDCVASGVGHARGAVPDPGASGGTIHFLREDCTFAIPAGAFSSPLTTKGDLHVYSTADDRLGVGANGTILAADSVQAKGVGYKTPGPGNAASLQALGKTTSTSYMTVPDNTALDATTAVSVSAWVKLRGINGGSGWGAFVKGTAAAASSAASCGDYVLAGTASSVFFCVNWSSGGCGYNACGTYSTALPLGEWHHLVGVYSTSGTTNAKLYIDGVLQATSGTYTTNLVTSGTTGNVGSYFSTAAGYDMNGSIDDLRIWKNVALTSSDVLALYNGGRGQFPLNAVSANETVAWRFDQTSGTTDTDVVSSLVLTSAGAQPVYWMAGIIPLF